MTEPRKIWCWNYGDAAGRKEYCFKGSMAFAASCFEQNTDAKRPCAICARDTKTGELKGFVFYEDGTHIEFDVKSAVHVLPELFSRKTGASHADTK